MARKGQARANGTFIRTRESAEMANRALDLRSEGKTYRQVAAELGKDVHWTHDAVNWAIRETFREAAEYVRDLELMRLDQMYSAVMAVLKARHFTVSQGKIIYMGDEPLKDDGPVLQAVDRLLKIQERRARYLGLDAEKKVSVSGGVKYEIIGIDPEQLK